MRTNNTDSKRYYDWMYHAWLDLKSARCLFEEDDLYEPVVFHCQQAVEKALKSFMLYKSRRLFDGHNVTWLIKQAALIDDGFARFVPKTVELNRFYIETRYPADIPAVLTKETAKDILTSTESIIGMVCGALKFDFNSYFKRKVRA